MTAQADYLETYQMIESQMSQIKALLNSKCQTIEPHYGHVGDLKRTSQLLGEIIEFMGGDTTAAAPNKFWVNTGNCFKAMTIPE